MEREESVGVLKDATLRLSGAPVRNAAICATAIALLFASTFAGGGSTEAASPRVVPRCGTPSASGSVVPAALPVRDAGSAHAPIISAKAAVVVDGETGRVLYGLNEHQQRAPASTTKIMTAILALENVSQDSWAVSDVDASQMIGSSVMGLWPGEYITMRDLLFGLMLPSGNDAAITIAQYVDGYEQDFVDRMNGKVVELGLENTQFRNPHGLDQWGHYSSAYDLAMIGRYAMANDAFREIASSRWHRLGPPADYDLSNGNSLLDQYPGADGVKIGWTENAGWTLVASAVRDGHRVFVTVLESEDRNADAAALLDWAFGTHEWQAIGARANKTIRLLSALGIGTPLVRTLGVCDSAAAVSASGRTG